MQANQARKDYRKMLKKFHIKKTLEEDLEDYESFYNADSASAKDGEESDADSIHFKNQRERHFYRDGEDMDFVRYHKRATNNFHLALSELLGEDKMTI
jgi:hypothetical protein